jgi:hypothetical protein
MIQLKKTILTLVALLALTTGAWAQSTLNVVEFEVPATWNGDNNPVTAGDLPGFKAVTLEEGQTWTGVPAEGSVVLVYAFDGDEVKYISFEKGKYAGHVSQPLQKVVIFGTSNIYKYYYTVGGASSASAVEVDWNKTSKTGTFSMPGGNVELEPEYYPQATAVEGAVVSMENLQATVDAELVTFDANGLTGSTSLMYYVSETATAPAYDAQGWTDKVPNAKDFTEACNRYVYYYLVGDDEHSDGDICANALYVTIAAAPTYAVTFADDTAEPTLWTASPNTDVKKGQTVTVTYTGNRHVKGVKAEKKAAKPVTLATALENGATIKVNFKWRNYDKGDYVQGVYNAASGTFTVSKGGDKWGIDARAVCKVEKSGDNIIIGACFNDFNDNESMVWTFNTTNDTYTTTNGADVKQFPIEYGLISVTVNDTDITSTLSELK